MVLKRFVIIIVPITIGLISVAAGCLFLSYHDLDILIVNGTVLDGLGNDPRVCDVAIRGGKIVGLGHWRFLFSRPHLVINAEGKIISPGFIDVHTHIESNLSAPDRFRPANFLRQGVTTIITGNCGRSRVDIKGLFTSLENTGTYINVASLIGHNSIREQVMGSLGRPPTSAEMAQMQGLVEQAMTQGALGLSTGLAYLPGRFAEQREIVSLARKAAEGGGLYVSHIRDEGTNGIEAINEALEIGLLSGAATHISHFKCSGPLQWHSITHRLQLIEDSRSNGVQATIDAYPYNCSSTTTDILLPGWALKENRTALRSVLKDLTIRQRLQSDIITRLSNDGWKDLTHVQLVSGRTEWVGRTLAEVPRPAFDINHQVDNLIEVSMQGGAQAIYKDMNENDVDAVITYPYCVFGSDSSVRDPGRLYRPHPRGCGTFPHIFRHYVREAKLLQVSQAVYKATGQPAKIFGLANRGYIRPGAWADIVIFDLNKIEDKADYDNPLAEPSGIEYVLVNGVVAIDHGDLTSNGPSGIALRRGK
jgi:N-acyl-D-amino-acid deacylase